MEQRQWTPAISADAASPHRANRSISSYRQRPIAWADIEAAAEAGGYAIRTPSRSSALATSSSGSNNSIDEDLTSQKNEGEAQNKSDREEEAEEEKETKGNATEVEARGEGGEDASSSSKSIEPLTLDSLSIAATDEEGAPSNGSSIKVKKNSRREKKPSKKDKKKARPGPFSPPASPSSSSDLVPTSSSSGKKDKKSKEKRDREREKEKQEKERKELMVRVSVPERRMVRMVVFPVDTTVQGALEQLFMRNPLADDPGLYGLALAVDPSFGNPFASTYASSSASSSVYLSTSPLTDASLASAAAPYTPPARWLDSQQLLSSYTIRPDQVVELKKKPPPLVVTMEDGTKRSILVDPTALGGDLAEVIVEGTTEDHNKRVQELFDFDLYCVVRGSAGAGKGLGAPLSSSPLSPSMSDSFWIDREKQIAAYGLHSMQPDRYLLQWKKRPHIIKVQPHSKTAQAGVAAKFTLKYYYDTTVKEAVKYLVGKYLGAEENPEEYSLQETTAQSLRRRRRRDPSDSSSFGSGDTIAGGEGGGHRADASSGLMSSSSGVVTGLGSSSSTVKEKIQLFNSGAGPTPTTAATATATSGSSPSSATAALSGSSGNVTLGRLGSTYARTSSTMALPTSRSHGSLPTAPDAESEDGFWLDGDDTLSQYDLAPTDTLHLRINPHKVVQEPENHVNVSFAEAPDVFPVLAALFQREEARRVAAGEDQQQVHGESAAATARSHFVRQFQIDFSTTVEDLTAAIIHFLRDNAGERAEVSLEGYGLFLLRADALEKDQATLLEPSSLILPLGLSLEDSLQFRPREEAAAAAQAIDSFFYSRAGGVSCRVAVPTVGVQVTANIGPDDLVLEVKQRLDLGLALPASQTQGWFLYLCDPYNGKRTQLQDGLAALSYPLHSGSVIEYGPRREVKAGASTDSAARLTASRGRGKAATQHIRVRLATRAGDDDPSGSSVAGDGWRVPFHPLSSTVDNLMEDVAQLGSDPSLYSGWRNFVGAASEGEESEAGAGARGLYMEAKDEEGGVWLLDPLALVASYGVEDEDVLVLKPIGGVAGRESALPNTVIIRVNIPDRHEVVNLEARRLPERKTFTFAYSASTLVEEALSFAFQHLRHEHAKEAPEPLAGATGSGAVAGLKPRPSLEVSGAEQYQRVEEQARWWEQQWLALETGDDSALGRRFGLFAGGAGGSFVNMASPAGTASLSATLTRPHFGGNTATWLSPLRTLASYDLTHRSVIDFQIRPIRIRVSYKNGQCLSVDVEPRCPVGELLLHCILNKPAHIKAYTKSQNLSLWHSSPDQPHGLWLMAGCPMSCYLGLAEKSTLKLSLRVHKEPCTFELVDGNTLVHCVDYSQPLKDILMAFSQKKNMHVLFKFNQRNLATLCVFARATKRRMDLAKSLRENGFLGGDASLVLVNKLVRVMSSSASIGGIQSPAVGRKGEPKRSAVEIGRRDAVQKQGLKASEELQQFLELAEKEDLQRDDNNAASEVDEGWIAAAERAGLGTNIWKEPADSPDNLVLDPKTGKVSAATLNKLVMRMTATTSSEDYDPKFMQAFLITYQSFTTPVVLLNKLLERYHVPTSTCEPGMSEAEWREKVVFPIQFRVVNILNQWLDTCFDDFDAFLVTKLNKFIQLSLPADGHSPLAKKLAKTLIKKTSADPKKLERIFAQAPPTPKVPRNLYSPNLNFFDIDDEEIARQITLIEYSMFAQIKHKELLQQAWNNPKLQHLSPNVLAFVGRFNVVSGWVSSMIVKVELLRNRVRMMTKIVNIAKCLYALNNFSSLMAFIAGWNTSSVIRLKWTMKDLPKKTIELRDMLEGVMSCDFSWRAYRTAIHEAKPPCLPYIGVYLQDLIFIEEGNPDNLGDLINFSKRELVASAIRELQQYQQQAYNLLEVPRISALFVNLPTKSDDELYNLSLKREPRGADRSAIA